MQTLAKTRKSGEGHFSDMGKPAVFWRAFLI